MSSQTFQKRSGTARVSGPVELLGVCSELTQRLLWALFAVALLWGLPARADDGHDHDKPPKNVEQGPTVNRNPSPAKDGIINPGGTSRPDAGGRTSGRRPSGGTGGCRVLPDALADFANGERYDYASMVTYLSDSACAAVAPTMGQLAVANGVVFNNKGPFKLDSYAKNILKNSLESSRRLDVMLKETMPPLLRQNPLSSAEMLPLLGQLAILSPSAGRYALAKVIEQELYAGDQLLKGSTGPSQAVAAQSLAATLIRLGAAEAAIANEMAESVEDMALLSQADSLGKYFRALSAAAGAEAALVPTFNLTAGSLNRGVQRGKGNYPPGAEASLWASVFDAIRTALSSNAALEPGAAELNEAFGALVAGAPVTEADLKRLWRDVVRVLALSTSQTSLADVVATSLTPEFMFLRPAQKESLMVAARNYPQVAGAVQATFLKSWARMWTDLNQGRLPVDQFNRIKQAHFEPMVTSILELDPYLIDPRWLGEVVSRGLVKDEDIERRFPRFVLSFLDRRERASRGALVEAGVEPTVSSLAENFAVLWNLSQIHVPALRSWVRRNDTGE